MCIPHASLFPEASPRIQLWDKNIILILSGWYTWRIKAYKRMHLQMEATLKLPCIKINGKPSQQTHFGCILFIVLLYYKEVPTSCIQRQPEEWTLESFGAMWNRMKAVSKSKVHSAEYKDCLPRRRKAVDANATEGKEENLIRTWELLEDTRIFTLV